jgi:O-antigen/teichoic acid export membrane protein
MSHKRKILQGSASGMLRVLLSMLVSLLLPPFLVHRMPPPEYSAWVLILQLSAYVYLLDFGLQTAIGKFVAQYDAVSDRVNSARVLSTSVIILSIAAVISAAIIGILTWRVPQLFHQMPGALLRSVREGLLAVGLTAAFSLPFGAFMAAFVGLQKYSVPVILSTLNRILSAAAVVGILLMHGSLVQLALVMAAFNVIAALMQFLGWRVYARERVDFSFLYFDRKTALQLVKYGGVLSLWTLAGLLISGLDVLIVGHYDYKNTGFYAVASSVTNFMLLVVGSIFGPILPAVSSIQAGAGSTPLHIGGLLVKVTRYCALALCLLGSPILIGAYPLLSLWVGHSYAVRSAWYLEILVLGNVVRQLTYPYALVVVATGKQHLATIAAVGEAIVNVVVSVLLVQKMGAAGVAIGTFVGAFVSVGMHVGISMHFTQSTVRVRRSRFVFDALLRPLLTLAPSLLLYPFWRSYNMLPANPALLATWAILTLAIAWRVGLTPEERQSFLAALSRLVYWRVEQT